MLQFSQGKHLCWSLFLALLKRDSNTGFFLLILQIFLKNITPLVAAPVSLI